MNKLILKNMKNIAYILLIGLLMISCSSEPHYVIKGKIAGSDSITFYIQKREAGKTITIDSAISKKGSFKMSGEIDYPQLIQLVAGDTRKRTAFYLENSKITIAGTLDSLFKAEIKGSKTHDEYQALINSNKPLTDKYASVYAEYQTASQAGDFARVEEIEKQADSLQTVMKNLQKDFVKNNPASYVSPSILVSLSYEMEAEEIDSAINLLDEAVAEVPQIVSLKERVLLMKTVSVGQKAPDFTMNDVDGNPVTLSSKFGTKLLLVDFWAAWCGPCRNENPNIVKVYNDFHKKGFDVFGVSLDQKKDDWVKAIADDKLTWTHVSDLQYWSNSAARLYAVNSIPASFLLDETGTIIGKNLRGEDLYNTVNDLLNQK
jgi:peroxiredoxin